MKLNIDNEYEKYLNPKIIEGKLTTNDLYHDLFMYLKELHVEIPTEKDKEMIMQNIGTYYDSLNTLLIKHTLEQPNNSTP
ncbi:MAG: hypothetical protein WC780_16720 [Lentimicrobiaceae bacterium]|jgi:hypothetical protein